MSFDDAEQVEVEQDGDLPTRSAHGRKATAFVPKSAAPRSAIWVALREFDAFQTKKNILKEKICVINYIIKLFTNNMLKNVV